ncbi:MAG: transcriptional regulator [Candidatus Thermoplasmatota archaeon]
MDGNNANVLEDLNPDLLNRKRLMIMTILCVSSPKIEADLQSALKLSWGDLDSNLRYLKAKGYISSKKVFTLRGPRTAVSVTKSGLSEYTRLVKNLKNLLKITELEEKIAIDDIFLLYRDGRLLLHRTRRLKPDTDPDILAGMFVAVQSFVKNSLRCEEGALERFDYGGLKILIARGQWVRIAAVVSGEEIEPIRSRMNKAIEELEKDHAALLESWDGRRDNLTPLAKYVCNLL